MLSRFLAGILCAVAMLAAVCADAAPQKRADYDSSVVPSNPLSRLFGFGSPIPRETIAYSGKYKPGTIIVNTRERRLYLILQGSQAIRYGIGVGRDGFTWGGVTQVTEKREGPDWNPPEQMLQRKPELPRHMPGGPANPLGARALYLGQSLYRIHGSNEERSIGTASSSGCFRLTNEDVIDLYNRVPVGATVVVQQ